MTPSSESSTAKSSSSEEREEVRNEVHQADVALGRDPFMRVLLRHLSGTLQDVVGLDEARGFVSIVGTRMGAEIGGAYRRALGDDPLTREQVADVMVDLKRRIQGDFYIIEESEEKIVLGNRACPFGEMVEGRPSLCMMTSNVFGSIAAENLGYAKVDVQKAIARGDEGCRVVIHLTPTEEAEAAEGREYYGEVVS